MRKCRVLSHGWRTAGNPDPDGSTLLKLRDFLESELKTDAESVRTTGIFIDSGRDSNPMETHCLVLPSYTPASMHLTPSLKTST